MNALSHPVAVPASHRQPPATFQPAGKGTISAGQLPFWARTNDARTLLAAIKIERPERTRVISETLCGDPAGYGYTGRNAAMLREIFDRAFDALLVADDGKHRDDLVRFLKDCSADAVIARVLS